MLKVNQGAIAPAAGRGAGRHKRGNPDRVRFPGPDRDRGQSNTARCNYTLKEFLPVIAVEYADLSGLSGDGVVQSLLICDIMSVDLTRVAVLRLRYSVHTPYGTR